MSRKRQIAKGLGFKVIFSVVGLFLFTSQISYKFYQYASLPPDASRHIAGAIIPAVKAPGVTFKYDFHHTSTFLSLDKRYDLAHIYFLPAWITRLAIPPLVKDDDVCLPDPRPVSRANLQASLRAPPVELL